MMADGFGVGGAHVVAATDWSSSGVAPMQDDQDGRNENNGMQNCIVWGRMGTVWLAFVVLCWVPCLHALATLCGGLSHEGPCIQQIAQEFVRNYLHCVSSLEVDSSESLREGGEWEGECGGGWWWWWVMGVMVLGGGGCGWWWWWWWK